MELSSRGLPIKTTIHLNHIGKTMASSMKASVDRLALSQLSREVDVSSLINQSKEISIPLNTLFMFVVARTLPQHPLLNAELVEDRIIVYEAINLGMAISTDNGLIVVVIPNADQLSLHELNKVIDDLANRARYGKIKLSDIEGGTFTVSNLGMFGIDGGVSIPRPPESAILLIGTARQRPTIVNGQITTRDICWLSLTFDHCFIEGVVAAEFLNDINDACNNLESLRI